MNSTDRFLHASSLSIVFFLTFAAFIPLSPSQLFQLIILYTVHLCTFVYSQNLRCKHVYCIRNPLRTLFFLFWLLSDCIDAALQPTVHSDYDAASSPTEAVSPLQFIYLKPEERSLKITGRYSNYVLYTVNNSTQNTAAIAYGYSSS